MSQFGDVVGKIEGEALMLAIRSKEERAAILGTILDLSAQADRLNRQMWAGIKERVALLPDRTYAFDSRTGEVRDDGPDVTRTQHRKPWESFHDLLLKRNQADNQEA